jgi:hypothetical protein
LEGEIGPGVVGLENEADGDTIGLGRPLPGSALEAKARLENCLLAEEEKFGDGEAGYKEGVLFVPKAAGPGEAGGSGGKENDVGDKDECRGGGGGGGGNILDVGEKSEEKKVPAAGGGGGGKKSSSTSTIGGGGGGKLSSKA